MKKRIYSAIAGAVVLGTVSASAWAAVDPFNPTAVTTPAPATVVVVAVPVSPGRTMVAIRPVVIAPVRPALISPIR